MDAFMSPYNSLIRNKVLRLLGLNGYLFELVEIIQNIRYKYLCFVARQRGWRSWKDPLPSSHKVLCLIPSTAYI